MPDIESLGTPITYKNFTYNKKSESSPAGCSVTLGGQLIGKTPLRVRMLSLVEHVLELSHDGYQTKSETFVTKLDVIERMNVQLEADLSSPHRRKRAERMNHQLL